MRATAERIAELKAEADAKAEFTRDNMLAFLAKVIRTESGQMRDRLRAIELLAKMCGWNQPEKFEHAASNELTEWLKRLRGGSPGYGSEPRRCEGERITANEAARR